jgi:hypothetical protein
LFTSVLKDNVDLPVHLAMRIVGNADAANFGADAELDTAILEIIPDGGSPYSCWIAMAQRLALTTLEHLISAERSGKLSRRMQRPVLDAAHKTPSGLRVRKQNDIF